MMKRQGFLRRNEWLKVKDFSDAINKHHTNLISQISKGIALHGNSNYATFTKTVLLVKFDLIWYAYNVYHNVSLYLSTCTPKITCANVVRCAVPKKSFLDLIFIISFFFHKFSFHKGNYRLSMRLSTYILKGFAKKFIIEILFI